MTLLLTPSELANIRGSTIHEIFILIRSNKIKYIVTENGIRIPIEYDNPQR